MVLCPKKSKLRLEAEQAGEKLRELVQQNKFLPEVISNKLIDDYIDFYETASKVKREIKKINNYNYKVKVNDFKRNYGINDLIKINQQMNNILDELHVRDFELPFNGDDQDDTI